MTLLLTIIIFHHSRRCGKSLEQRLRKEFMAKLPSVLHVLSRLPQEVSSTFPFKSSFSYQMCRVLLATICDKGLCPCPHCMVKKTSLTGSDYGATYPSA